MKQQTILITGALGQIGSELVQALETRYERVISSDLRCPKNAPDNFIELDVLDKKRMTQIIGDYRVNQIYHLAAILSAKGEQNPLLAWEVNLKGGLNILDVASVQKLNKVFWPSSIAVFGERTPKEQTPQHTITDPSTIYGITKLAGERWSHHYFHKHGLDVRSIRYPGLISHVAMPGGGTTDYAVEIFHEAIKNKHYSCFVGKETRLPMMYMPDAIRATVNLMEVPSEKVRIRSAYNVAGMSFTPEELAFEIKRIIPDFKMEYALDFRDKIAKSWPSSIDDSDARRDWGWQPAYDLRSMTTEMISKLQK